MSWGGLPGAQGCARAEAPCNRVLLLALPQVLQTTSAEQRTRQSGLKLRHIES